MVCGSIQAAYDLYVTVCKAFMPKSIHRHHPSLAGASIIITRPAASAGGLIRAAKARAAGVVLLPGVAIRPIEDADAAQSALLAALSADGWIFTSPNAVRYCRRLLTHVAPADWPRVLAVGEGTRRALARHGIAAIAPKGAQNSEGLLAEAELKVVEGKSLVIIDAPGGRDLLAPTLRQRGARAVRIAVYQRESPVLQESHLAALATAPRPWISLVSSSVILNNLMTALPHDLCRRWQQAAIVLSSERLVAKADELGFSDVHQARSALSKDLLESAAQVLCRHRL